MNLHKFRRVVGARKVAGVCGGMAYALGIPVWIVRIILLCLTIFSLGAALIVYLILWVSVPKWESDPNDVTDVIN